MARHRLDTLPTELVVGIAEYLPPLEAASLSLVSNKMLQGLGTSHIKLIRRPPEVQDQHQKRHEWRNGECKCEGREDPSELQWHAQRGKFTARRYIGMAEIHDEVYRKKHNMQRILWLNFLHLLKRDMKEFWYCEKCDALHRTSWVCRVRWEDVER